MAGTNIPSGGSYKINGVDITSTLKLKQSTGLTYNPANPFLFDNDYQYNNYTLTADITPTYSLTNAVALNGVSITFIGDGTHTVNFTNFTESELSGAFDITNGAENKVIFFYDGIDVFYSITSALKLASSTETGVLSNTDWTTFNNKQTALISGTNIKTINSTSLLGSGDVSVQSTLVSGTNIKTINGTSVLGSGDITISSGVTPTDNILDWDAGNSWYAPYSSKQASMSFYTGTTDPTLTTRLNIDADLHLTKLSLNTTSSYAITAITSGAPALYATSSSGYSGIIGGSTGGLQVSAITGNPLYVDHSGVISTSIGEHTITVYRSHSGTGNLTGNILNILDNPTTSGTISGQVLSATIGNVERISLNPRVTPTGSATAYLFDTHNNLIAGDRLFSLKQNGTDKAYFTEAGTLYALGGVNSSINEIKVFKDASNYNRLSLKYHDIVVGGTLRVGINPNVTNEATSTAYLFDTINNLTITGAKLLSVKNQGVEKASIDKDGGITSAALTGTGDRPVGVDSNGKFKVIESTSTIPVIHKASVTLTATNLINSEWVQVVPSQTNGKMAIIEKIILFYNYGTVAYSANEFTFQVSYNSGTSVHDGYSTSTMTHIIESTTDAVWVLRHADGIQAAPLITNNAIYVRDYSGAISGDGTLTVNIYYSIIDI